MEYNLYGYYGIDPMWGGGYYGSNAIERPLSGPDLLTTAPEAARHDLHKKGDPHLRSLAEVTGYNLHATDGEIGHVECFLIDDDAWEIRYLVADTRNWWFGKHVLLSPAAVQAIRWDEHRIDLNLTCYKIKASPPRDATGLLDRAYETLLQAHYDWPARFLPAKRTLAATPANSQAAARAEARS